MRTKKAFTAGAPAGSTALVTNCHVTLSGRGVYACDGVERERKECEASGSHGCRGRKGRGWVQQTGQLE